MLSNMSTRCKCRWETIWDPASDTHAVLGWSTAQRTVVLAFRCGHACASGCCKHEDCPLPNTPPCSLRPSPPCTCLFAAPLVSLYFTSMVNGHPPRRGTASLLNVLTDAKAWKVKHQAPWRQRGRTIMVHAGKLTCIWWQVKAQRGAPRRRFVGSLCGVATSWHAHHAAMPPTAPDHLQPQASTLPG